MAPLDGALDTSIPDVEELARELYLALSEQEMEDDMDFVQVNLGSLPSWAKRMLEKVEELLEKSKSFSSMHCLLRPLIWRTTPQIWIRLVVLRLCGASNVAGETKAEPRDSSLAVKNIRKDE